MICAAKSEAAPQSADARLQSDGGGDDDDRALGDDDRAGDEGARRGTTRRLERCRVSSGASNGRVSVARNEKTDAHSDDDDDDERR
jgi:hypothetical protein